MFQWFKKKSVEETPQINKSDDLMSKLQERQNIFSKLDFNPEHMNKYLTKCIASYLSAIYKQDPSLCKKFVGDGYFATVVKDVEDSKKMFRYSNDYVNIVNAELQEQTIESVNFISEIIIKVTISSVYNKENVFTGTIKKIEEGYSEYIVFKYYDTGWKMEDIQNQNFNVMNEEVIRL